MTKKKKNDNYLGNNKHLPEVQELLKSYAHLDQTNDFIGSQFSTPKGGVITVVGDNLLKGNKKRFIVHCSLSPTTLQFSSLSALGLQPPREYGTYIAMLVCPRVQRGSCCELYQVVRNGCDNITAGRLRRRWVNQLIFF